MCLRADEQIVAAILVLAAVQVVELLPAPQFVPLGNNFAYDVINSPLTRFLHFFRHVLPNTPLIGTPGTKNALNAMFESMESLSLPYRAQAQLCFMYPRLCD